MARIASRLLLWHLPALVGCAAAVVFAIGFALALRGPRAEPPGVSPRRLAATTPRGVKKPGDGRLLLVLGDSLARGTGDADGRGFAADVLDRLRRSGPVEIANLAVNGAESGDLLRVVSQPNVRTLVISADLILISAGGNDLSHAVPRDGAERSRAGLESVSMARRRLAENLRSVLGIVRETNSSVPIVVLGLYDPFGDPSERGRLGASVILGWNAVVAETALSFPGVHVVPTFDLFEGRPDRLSVDRFHPNRAGYAAIAERIAQILPAGL